MNKKLNPTITQLRPPPLPAAQPLTVKAALLIGLLIGGAVVAALPYVVRWLA